VRAGEASESRRCEETIEHKKNQTPSFRLGIARDCDRYRLDLPSLAGNRFREPLPSIALSFGHVSAVRRIMFAETEVPIVCS
jgi:hypothetical protein